MIAAEEQDTVPESSTEISERPHVIKLLFISHHHPACSREEGEAAVWVGGLELVVGVFGVGVAGGVRGVGGVGCVGGVVGRTGRSGTRGLSEVGHC